MHIYSNNIYFYNNVIKLTDEKLRYVIIIFVMDVIYSFKSNDSTCCVVMACKNYIY